MITVSIDEKDGHVLRVTASYLLALAAVTQVSAEDANLVTNVHNQLVEAATFNATELDESAKLDALHNTIGSPYFKQDEPSAAEVFGAGKSVPYIVGVDPSTTAPVDTAGVTSIPNPPGDQLAPVVFSEEMAKAVAAPMVNPANPVELDVNGLPWDARIHSREKTKIVAGSWKYKRGVPENTVKAVEAELRQLMQLPAAQTAPLPTVAAIVPPPPTATIVPPPPASTAPPANPSNPLESFVKLMTKFSSAIAEGKITLQRVTEIVNAHGIASIGLMSSRLDLIPQVEAEIDATIAAGG